MPRFDEEVNTKIIETIAEHFSEITVMRGRKHKLLVINIEFLRNMKLSLFIQDYLGNQSHYATKIYMQQYIHHKKRFTEYN